MVYYQEQEAGDFGQLVKLNIHFREDALEMQDQLKSIYFLEIKDLVTLVVNTAWSLYVEMKKKRKKVLMKAMFVLFSGCFVINHFDK